jgi:molybdopterin-guanine dinucleotide biosynthesis protein A
MKMFGSAVILAGGKSTRMGFDKQLLQVQGGTIVQHLIGRLECRFADIMVSSAAPELYDPEKVRVIQDIYQDVGPLGGIHAALVSAKSEAVFVIACDMPYVEVSYIDFMMGELEKGSYDACVTGRGDHLEVFHSFFCRSALASLESELAAGHFSVQRFTKKINSLIIPESEATKHLPDWRAFTNINTPEEYAEFQRKGEEGKTWK